jgi:signal transduction histidine kinase
MFASLFRPIFRADTYRSLLFLAAAVPVAAVALGFLIAGWTSAAVLAITPLVIPILIGFRGAIGLLARADAALGRSLLDADTHPEISSGGSGFWGRGKAVIVDPAFWKRQVYLALRMTVGFAVAVGEFALIAAAFGAIAFPAWYRWSDLHFGSWQVDTFARSWVLVPMGLVGIVVAAHLARALGAASAWTLRGLLAETPDKPSSAESLRQARRRALSIHAGFVAGLFLTCVIAWAASDGGYFWPEWVVLPLALFLAVHAWIEYVADHPWLGWNAMRRNLSIHAGVVVALLAFLTLIWAVTSRGYFWPGWVALPLVSALGVHALVTRSMRRNRLAKRVETLETTRAGAVDAQDAELRRIERDIHDGAQARLVALGMRLGMAEQKFESDPEEAQRLVVEVREGVAEALGDLRDLARGIYPPVLADRGLEPALESLAERSAIPVSVTVQLDKDLPQPVETAAYFVAAEALANAAKHSHATKVDIDVSRHNGTVSVQVTDDGRGGANAGGSGLTGLRRRVEALDGSLVVPARKEGRRPFAWSCRAHRDRRGPGVAARRPRAAPARQ